MVNKSLKNYKQIHCIGIGGSGLSGLAQILNSYGLKISGSDQTISATTGILAKKGIKIFIGHKAQNLPANTGLVIFSPAVPANNPERQAALKKNIPQISYPQAVGLLTKDFETISICGTHGKTTTTGLIASAFIKDKQDPTVIVGSVLKELKNSNQRVGKGQNFILESCEYRRGFLNYRPAIIVMNNIEADHLDYYKDLKDYIKAFREFAALLPKNGLIIANYDDINVLKITKNHPGKVIYFGENSGAHYQLKKSTVLKNGKIIAKLNLKIPGGHNRLNAVAAIATCTELGLNIKNVLAAINSYHGAKRRFQIKGKVGKTIIIDDYAHHPTEIKATLKAVREKYGRSKKVLCVFQPHQYSRTRELLKDFAKSFNLADEVIIPNILKVRDSAKDVASISPQKLVQAIAKNQPNTSFGDGFPNTIKIIRKRLKDYDIVITMGAGNVWQIANSLCTITKRT